MVLPLRDRVRRDSGGRLVDPVRWQRRVSDEGRLGRLAAFGAEADSLTWLVDPAVLDAVASVAADNPALSTAADGTGPDEGTAPPEPSTDGSTEPAPEGTTAGDDEAVEELSAEAVQAAGWLDDFVTESSEDTVLGLPYGDLDVPAVTGNRLDGLLEEAQRLTAGSLATLGLDAAPVVAPPRGFLPSRVLDQIDPDTAVLMTDKAFPGIDATVLGRADGTRVALSDSAALAGGPGPDARRSQLALRQRLLSEAALHALSPQRDRPVVVALPTGFNPAVGSGAAFFAGLDVPWLRQVGLDEVIDAGPELTASQRPLYPAGQRTTQIPLGNQLAAQELGELGQTYAELLTLNDSVGDELARFGLLAASYQVRTRAGAASTRARETATRVRRTLQGVVDRRPLLRQHDQRGRPHRGDGGEPPRRDGHGPAGGADPQPRPDHLGARGHHARARSAHAGADAGPLLADRGAQRDPGGHHREWYRDRQPGPVQRPLEQHRDRHLVRDGRRAGDARRRHRVPAGPPGAGAPTRPDRRRGDRVTTPEETTAEATEDRSMLTSSAVMAAGTVVSRASGFVRTALLGAALGLGLHAELFNVANTVPNMLYILLAGGLFNAVLVPQLVRAMKNDADGGEAYAQRIMTLAAVFLAAVTILLVVAAPLLMRLFLAPSYFTPDLVEQRESAIAFARYCLPQVFFYGMFVLVGQVLNSRGSFGPMMWAPIANNVITVLVLVGYLLTYGPAVGAELSGGFTAGQEALLGIGSTLGIAVQLLVLVPYLRRAGFRLRLRFDVRGAGLGHTLRLGVWTVLFVVVNQIAYTIVVRIASRPAPADDGTGYTVYSLRLPHHHGAALDRDGVAGDGDAAAAVAARRRRGSRGRRPQHRRDPAPGARPDRAGRRS